MESNPSESVKKRIRAIIKARRLKIKDVAAGAQMVAPQLSEYLTTDKAPSLAVLDRIAKSLGLQLWELLKPEDAEPTPNSPTIEILQRTVNDLTARLAEIEARQDQAPAAKAPHLKDTDDELFSELLSLWASLDKHERHNLVRVGKAAHADIVAELTNSAQKNKKSPA